MPGDGFRIHYLFGWAGEGPALRNTGKRIVQQLREAFPFDSPPRFLIFDRDAKYALEVPAVARSLRISPVRTSLES